MRALPSILIACVLAGPAFAQIDSAAGQAQPNSAGPIPIAEGPQRLSAAPASYPPAALQRRVQALCAMTFTISDAGEPENICGVCTAVDRRGKPANARMEARFLDAISAALPRWRFEPDGSGQAYWASMEYLLEDQDPLPEAPAPIMCEAE